MTNKIGDLEDRIVHFIQESLHELDAIRSEEAERLEREAIKEAQRRQREAEKAAERRQREVEKTIGSVGRQITPRDHALHLRHPQAPLRTGLS